VDRWWSTFNDPILDSLINRAVRSNLDLLEAQSRIREARATRGIASSGLFPVFGTSGNMTRAGNAVGSQELWRGGFDASWEVDIFGGVRRQIEAATADIEAAVENRRAVTVSLVAEVAADYLFLRGFQQELVVAGQNLDIQIRNAAVARGKVQLGSGTGLDVSNADAQVASTRATIASFISQEQQQVYALSILLGLEPSALMQELQATGPIPVTPPIVPVGLPSELLRRRPDIRQAERQLAGQTARIGVAVADLFPRFSLTGSLNFQASRFQPMFNWNNRSWSFGPSVSWNIFDAGRIWSNVEVQNAIQEQALINYRRTVLIALQDVENALVAYAQEQQRRAALAEAVAANQKALEQATTLYRGGLTDFLRVIDAERSLFGTQDALVQSNRAVGTDLVALYKALGGGWEAVESGATTRPALQ
jgi:NodT family efflux transporter outer membrane factor (OMF) lipoprotein